LNQSNSTMASKLLILSNGNIWKAGKFYVPRSSLTKKGLSKVNDSFTFKGKKYYTLDKTRRVKGLAPKNLL